MKHLSFQQKLQLQPLQKIQPKEPPLQPASANDEDSDTITYSLAGTGSENFSIDADGKVTLASDLDYETTTSYEITIIASDGSNSIQGNDHH